MSNAPTRQNVLAALEPLRAMLSADGYELRLEATDPVPVLTVEPGDGCGECLIPRTIMEPLVGDMLVAGGIPPAFSLNYPTMHADA